MRNNFNTAFVSIIITASIVVTGLSDAAAQQRRNIFADPQNLKVLPEDISSEELRNTMRGFTRQLGVRCSSCHVGEEDQSIFDYDFAADDKALKLIARDMIKMVGGINETVSSLDRGDDHEFVQVNCVTCHRGQSRPRMIEDILADVYEEDGVDAAIAEYTSLRDRFYGGFVYDFTARRLAEFAQSLAASSPEDAFDIHELNVELNPEDGAAYMGRGQAHQQRGDLQAAVNDYQKAMDVDSDYAFLQQQVEALEKQMAPE